MMTFYKVCLTLIVLASVGVTARSLLEDLTSDHQRSRRSSSAADGKNEQQANSREDHASLQAGYRFGDEFFNPAASTKTITAEYEKNTDGCERIVKDSMICMLCKDPKTNSKYEQCSYVSSPKDRSYYTEKNYKSPSVNNGNVDRNEEREEAREKNNDDGDDDDDDDSYSSRESFGKSSHGRYENEDDQRETAETAPASSSFTETDKYKDDRSNEQDETSGKCRRIEKNSKICTICKDRKTGSDFERCSSGIKNNRPNDEVNEKNYNYEKSDKYGRYPSENDEIYEREENFSPSSSLYRSVGYQTDEINEKKNNEKKRNNNSRKRSNNKPGANKSKGCKKVQKDSMTCTVCVDPETGGNFEKCSYTHQPNDKIYKFSKSKTFGYPENSDDETNSENRR